MATSDGITPWVAPLAYVVEPNYSFIYYSAVEARHSQHIKKTPSVACAIFDSRASSDKADGVQFSATVSELLPNELGSAMALYFEQSFPDPNIRQRWIRPTEDFMGASAQRFYRITPKDIFTLDLTSQKIDRRIQVNLEDL